VLPSQHPASGKLAAAQRPSAYVCAGTTCSAPTFDIRALHQTLDAAMVESSLCIGDVDNAFAPNGF
jgi:hypothetical protein